MGLTGERMSKPLETHIGSLILRNPVIAASGTFGLSREYKGLIDARALGAVVTKSITLAPCQGTRPPRICETTAGMLNAIGLQNDGVEDFIKEKLPALKAEGAKVIVSIAGTNKQDYRMLAKALDSTEADAIEINISCPNVEHKGACRLFAQDAVDTASITRSVKRQTNKPVIVKLSPNVTDITAIARSAEKAGADALSLINTLLGMDVDIAKKRPCLANITGGLSGPAIKPVALRMVFEVYKSVKIPIIGMGGIMNTHDALSFFICGATAIQVGTANFVNPNTAVDIISGLSQYVKSQNLRNINELVGKLKT